MWYISDVKIHTNVRMCQNLKAELEKEAKNDGRTFTNYVERLLSTHQIRKKEFKK